MSAAAAWTEVVPGVHVRQSKAFWMNSVVLLDAAHTIVLDPGVLPSELDDLARFTESTPARATTLVFTHAHWDHVLGRPWWPKAKTIAHDRAAAEMRRDVEKIRGEAATLAEQHGERWAKPFEPFKVDSAVSGLHFLKLEPWRLVMRDAPGHSDSQLSVHLPDRRVLIAADMLSDIEIPTLDGPIAPYRETLMALALLADHGAIETIIPGHGSVANGRDAVVNRFRRDLAYLDALDAGVRDAAAKGQPVEAAEQALAAMEYTNKRSTLYPNEPMHLENIRIAYQAAAAHRR
jgi:hydroxyacylglutathione hydrolase